MADLEEFDDILLGQTDQVLDAGGNPVQSGGARGLLQQFCSELFDPSACPWDADLFEEGDIEGCPLVMEVGGDIDPGIVRRIQAACDYVRAKPLFAAKIDDVIVESTRAADGSDRMTVRIGVKPADDDRYIWGGYAAMVE